MKWLNIFCSLALEIVFLLFFILVMFAPLHAAATRHFTVVQTIDSTHAVIAGDVHGLSAGSSLALYRFNHDWKSPIGNAHVERIGQGVAYITIDSAMAFPLGVSSPVVQEADGTIAIPFGSAAGIGTDQFFTIFRDRTNVGVARIEKVEADRSFISISATIGSLDGLIVSQFTFATQAAVYDDPLLSGIEYAAIVLVLAAYALLYVRFRRSPFILIGERVRALSVPRTPLRWIVHVLAGVPFVWFMAKMPLYLGAYLFSYMYLHLFTKTVYLIPFADSVMPYMYGLMALLYYGYLLWKRRSPVIAFWHLISYKGRSSVKTVSFTRGLVMWTLHLIIVYFFASTLIGFFFADINAALVIGFPAPSIEASFEQWKYIIWALTVVGVLLGYGYSLVSILWGSYIRNLDFTVTGWLTNAFCYPLLGVVIWQMIPSFTGVDPIIVGGPLQSLMLILGLLLNILYMLSIWNLGILFDLMADKGVRTSGFYSVIRHPNYTLEVSMFFVTELIGLSAGIQWLAIGMYFFLYWIRSEREDNFMGYSNPAYEPYRAATPYKFIPGIY